MNSSYQNKMKAVKF